MSFPELNHEPPAPPVADIEQAQDDEQMAALEEPQPTELPQTSVVARGTGVVILPSLRFDGDQAQYPWFEYEPLLADHLRDVEIEDIDELSLNLNSGFFIAHARGFDQRLVSFYLKIDGLGRRDLYEYYGTEFLLDKDQYDLLRRELAAYEAAKALGNEDLVPPLAARRIEIDGLLSDYAKEQILGSRIPGRGGIQQTIGEVGIAQMMVPRSDDFVEYWSKLGATDTDRWLHASDRLRHSLYRTMVMDFLLWCPNRPLASLQYNRDSDRVAISDLSICLPHPGFTAENYIRQRNRGWGRVERMDLNKKGIHGPVHGMDIFRLVNGMNDHNKSELFKTLFQFLAYDEEVLIHLGKVMLQHGVPAEAIAGFYARLHFLIDQPMSVLDPMLFARNFLVPCRRGFGEAANQEILTFANELTTTVTGSPVDFLEICQEPLDPEAVLV